MKRLVILGGGESGVGTALLGKQKGYEVFVSDKGEILKIMEPGESGNIEMEIPVLKKDFKNKNDLIFFILLFTYLIIFLIFKIKYNEK